MTSGRDLRQTGERIEGLLEELRQADPGARERAEELVRLLVEAYGAGLSRIVEVLRDRPGGEEVLRQLAEDPAVSGLLVLHDLHPVPVEQRIQEALDRVRPYLGSHAGGIEFLGFDGDGVARLRLEGSCHGCPSSTLTVKLAVERAVLEAAPEVSRIEVEGLVEEPGPRLLQVGPLGSRSGSLPSGGGWVVLEGFRSPLPGQAVGLEVEGVPVVFCSAAGSLYAYRDACPSCGGGLAGGRLEGGLLACPSCGVRYDVARAGRSPDRPDLHLDPLPLLPEKGGWKVALPSEVRS